VCKGRGDWRSGQIAIKKTEEKPIGGEKFQRSKGKERKKSRKWKGGTYFCKKSTQKKKVWGNIKISQNKTHLKKTKRTASSGATAKEELLQWQGEPANPPSKSKATELLGNKKEDICKKSRCAKKKCKDRDQNPFTPRKKAIIAHGVRTSPSKKIKKNGNQGLTDTVKRYNNAPTHKSQGGTNFVSKNRPGREKGLILKNLKTPTESKHQEKQGPN